MYPKHFDGKRYFNPGSGQARGFGDVLRWQLRSRPAKSPAFVDDVTPAVPAARVEDGSLRVTMVNHSTVLLQWRGCNLLTDPVWSERVSPVSWAGPRRRRAAGVRWEDLPEIDVVLLSHNHYDHLDLPVLRRLKAGTFVAPLGVPELLAREKVGPVQELDWDGKVAAAGGTVHCVPALHFSARGLFDRNRTLWCGYVIEAAGRKVYFAGDTGFGWHFAAIRERFGPVDVALLPIGAYEPRWFMGPVHMAPDEAVKAHDIVGAGTSIGIHHGTFQLTEESIDTPAKELRACAGGRRFLVLNNGEAAELP